MKENYRFSRPEPVDIGTKAEASDEGDRQKETTKREAQTFSRQQTKLRRQSLAKLSAAKTNINQQSNAALKASNEEDAARSCRLKLEQQLNRLNYKTHTRDNNKQPEQLILDTFAREVEQPATRLEPKFGPPSSTNDLHDFGQVSGDDGYADDDEDNYEPDHFRHPSECRLQPGDEQQQQQQPGAATTTTEAAAVAAATIKEEDNVNLSFCGCGFLGIYHVGVASCFHQYAPQLGMHKISGSSAGALVAVAHICGNLQLAYCTTDILRVAIEARARALGPFHPSFDIQALVREALERGLPHDVHLKSSGKLHISLTRVYDGKNVIISEYESKEDVIQALLCSCFIPFWSGLVAPKYKGVTYIDGGFSDNLLILDDKTVTVSPFSGEADICPQDDSLNLLQISLSNTSFSLSPNNIYRLSHALLPPAPEVLSDLCEQGFADGIRYLQRMKLISCTKCLEIRSSLLVTTNGEDMEQAFATGSEEPSAKKQSASSVASESNDLASTFSLEKQHIRLEQQEQKMIAINPTGSCDSLSSSSQVVYSKHQLGHTTTERKRSKYRRRSRRYATTNGSFASVDNEIKSTEGSTSISFTVNNGLDTAHLSGSGSSRHNQEELSCNECLSIRLRALRDPLPTQFSDRIRDACDAVNKSLSNWLYSYRPIKYLSYLMAPYYMPVDVSLALVCRLWNELPLIRGELVNCLCQIAQFLIGIVKRMHSKSMTSRLLGGCSVDSDWDSDAMDYEKQVISRQSKQQQRERRSSQTNGSLKTQTTTTTTTTTTLTSKTTATSTTTKTTETTTTKTKTRESNNNNCYVTEDKQQPTTNKSAVPSKRLPLAPATSTGNSQQVPANSSHQHQQQQQLHSLEDTFDSIVDVTSNQEARIFAYYFRDAKNRLQVTEIFDLERAAELQQRPLSHP